MSRLAVATTAILATAAIAGCKGRKQAPPAGGSAGSAAPGDAAVPAMDWPACEAALLASPTLPAGKRAMALIEACRPCGDWTPILDWQRQPSDGGPAFKVLEHAMLACKAFCDATGKQRFLGTVDDARAKQARTPWRELGDYCKATVSAVPDSRYVSAPYFALDRIARAVGERANTEALLAAIEIPLPAISLSGVGLALPDAPVTKPELVAAQITITVRDVSTSTLPIAKLSRDGVTVVGGPYPGNLVALPELAAALGAPSGRVAVFAPAALPAARLAEVTAAVATHPLVLASTSRSGPPGWTTFGLVPVTLTGTPTGASVTLELGASPDPTVTAIKAATPQTLLAAPVRIVLGPDATVQSLATVLGALAFLDVPSVALSATPPTTKKPPKR